ncbi:DUF805 domain-containing protein [Hirschia litorea]|uniref:DUF805 domain-containing protein n=1 Tax=Hirschia litorea TaxID=1199156 RepID=A0ABW2IPY2_9PROT
MLDYLFSFDGRIGRGGWWLRVMVIQPVIMSIGFLTMGLLYDNVGPTMALLPFFTLIAGIVAGVWVNIAAGIRRYHDLGRTWTNIFGVFIPVIGPIMEFYSCGFKAGDLGPNTFGHPPKSASGGSTMRPRHRQGDNWTENIDFGEQTRVSNRQNGNSLDFLNSDPKQGASKSPSNTRGSRSGAGTHQSGFKAKAHYEKSKTQTNMIEKNPTFGERLSGKTQRKSFGKAKKIF